MRFLTLIFLFPLLLIFSACQKDAPSSDQKDNFIKFYGDAYFNEATDMIQVGNNYYLLINHTTKDENSWILLKYVDEYGNIVWEEEYGKAETNRDIWGNSLIELSNNNIAIVGTSKSGQTAFDTDISLLIINPDDPHVPIMDTVYNGSLIEQGFCIGERMEGGLLLAGTQKNILGTTMSQISLSIDNSFNIEKVGRANPISIEILGSMIPTENGDFLLAGSTLKFSKNEASINKITSEGINIDYFPSNGGIDGIYNDVKIIDNTQLIVAGTNYKGSKGRNDAHVSLFSSVNNQSIWAFDFGGTLNDDAKSVTLAMDNNILVVGSQSNASGNTDIFVFKLDMEGHLIDTKEVLLGGADNEKSVKIFADPKNSDSFLVFGNSSRDESSSAILIKSSF